jgi:low affinity Fe/Cu permease
MRPTKSTEWFTRFAKATSRAAGRPSAFIAAVGVVVLWIVTGPLFRFSDSWQLVINTGTTVVTFLMVFLIQATQNRDATALHLKLDELIRSTREARNTFAALEDASEDELKGFQDEFRKLRDEGHSETVAAVKARERLGSRERKD